MSTQQTDPTITRAISIMRAAMGITQPAIIEPIIQIAAPEVVAPVSVPQKAVASASKPVKSRAKPQKEIGKPPVRDVWFYLLGHDKKAKAVHHD